MTRIRKLLVANRGEIAVRIQRTARRMGIATVAVYSDADADTLHVKVADQAVRLGPAPSSESYLRAERIIDAARRSGADAVHPGFGFLAENAAFAAACREAGLVFVGPSAESIRALGLKKEAKALAVGAGVPVVPGYAGDDQSISTLAARALEIGFPVLIKASAGGGGKGMRIVRQAEGLEAALEAGQREAQSAFGDGTLLLEKYVERPRHVEIQILGDQHGQLVHLFERECSIQRRHQKVIEESPSPLLDTALRERMGAAGVAVGRAVGYYGAGTVEFIVAPDGAFYFLEVNTRLQVEHPVTELTTGVDLVEQQIRVARGERLQLTQQSLAQSGHAVEVRLYAEDVEAGFLPASGRVVDWHVPDLPGLRVDTGIQAGSDVSIHYDPMIAKVIAHGPTRDEALETLVSALRGTHVQGLTTNRAFLIDVLDHEAFRAGDTHTHFIEQHFAGRTRPAPSDAQIRRAVIAATLAARRERLAERALLPALAPGFRNHRAAPERYELGLGDRVLAVEYEPLAGDRLRLTCEGVTSEVQLVSAAGPELVVEDAGLRTRARVVRGGSKWFVHADGSSVELVEVPRFPEAQAKVAPGACVAPMPGKVVKILVSRGQRVAAGDVLLILEAMKMEHGVRATADGDVEELHVAEGDQVDAEAVLAVVR